jgi:outer membrane protein TolC
VSTSQCASPFAFLGKEKTGPFMNRCRLKMLLLCATWEMLACAAPKHYRPAPMSPTETAASLEGRSLLDTGLRQFITQSLTREPGAWPPGAWDLRLLTLAAFYFNPALEASRARAAAASAAITTAGARPNPILSVAPGVPSPYLLGLEFALPIETAGKRGYRVREATQLSEAARLDLAATAWRVRSGVRTALLDHFMAMHNLELARSQEHLRSELVDRLQRRLAAGEIARPEVVSTRLELLNARAVVRGAEGHLSETKAALAAAIGVPAAGLDGAHFSWDAWEKPPDLKALSPRFVQREAVLNRLDLRRALAEYAAAEAALQLEIARQRPDIDIGPGYQLEEHDSFFTLGLSVTVPLFNRNQGPIAEAEARRKEAAARFLSTQSQAIAESEAALARYRTAFSALESARTSLDQLQDTVEPLVRSAVAAGESDWITLQGTRLQVSAAAIARFDALYNVQAALGQVEDAVERPLEPGDIAPLTPQSPLLNRSSFDASPKEVQP